MPQPFLAPPPFHGGFTTNRIVLATAESVPPPLGTASAPTLSKLRSLETVPERPSPILSPLTGELLNIHQQFRSIGGSWWHQIDYAASPIAYICGSVCGLLRYDVPRTQRMLHTVASTAVIPAFTLPSIVLTCDADQLQL